MSLVDEGYIINRLGLRGDWESECVVEFLRIKEVCDDWKTTQVKLVNVLGLQAPYISRVWTVL